MRVEVSTGAAQGLVGAYAVYEEKDRTLAAVVTQLVIALRKLQQQ